MYVSVFSVCSPYTCVLVAENGKTTHLENRRSEHPSLDALVI